MYPLDTATLQAFLKVAQLGSFSQAAEALFITQSAVSKRILHLEEQLGVKVFDRIGRRVSLTQAGQILLPQATKILHAFEDASRSLQNLSGQVSGRLSLSASHHISLHRLPPILKQYAQKFPQVELDLRFDASEVAYEGILQGEKELALITLATDRDPRLFAEPIWTDRLHYAVSRDHPLAQRDNVTLEDLITYPAILPRVNTFTHQLVINHLQQQQLTPHLGISTNALDTIAMMVQIGLGWSALPETMLNDKLVCPLAGIEPIQRPLGVIYHRDRTLSNAARELLELLHAAREITS